MSMGNADKGCELVKLVVGCGQGNPFGKLLDCALLNPAENGKIQGLVADDTRGCGVGNVEDMCLDSLGRHILLQVGLSRQLEDCTRAEEHEVAHLHESVEEVQALLVMTAVSVIVLSVP